MRHLAKPLALLALLMFAAPATAQEGKVLFERNITIPRDFVFGDQTLQRGTYRLALTEIDSEKWFVLSKSGQEVGRDLALDLPLKEIPTQGFQAELLKGGEYYRARVRQGDTVYLIHFLVEGGEA